MKTATELMELLGAQEGDTVTLAWPPPAPNVNRSVCGKLIRTAGVWALMEIQTERMKEPLVVAWDVTGVDQAWAGGAIEVRPAQQCDRCKQPFVPSSDVDVYCQKCMTIVPAKAGGGPVIVGPEGGNA